MNDCVAVSTPGRCLVMWLADDDADDNTRGREQANQRVSRCRRGKCKGRQELRVDVEVGR